MTRYDLHILGCGSAKPTMRHRPSCQVLNVRDNLFMIDCGEGAQLAMQRQHLKFSRLRHIFISHLHGDHCLGLPGLISTLALHGQTGEVVVHTFADGARLMGDLIDFLCRERPFTLRFNIISTRLAVIYESDSIVVSTFPLNHRVPAVGFLVKEKPKLRHIRPEACSEYQVPHWAMNTLRQGGDYVTPQGIVVPNEELTLPPTPSISYAYCSDTRPAKRVVEAIEGVDWLYHEATYDSSCAKQARARYHSTALEAATVAREAGVKRLVIGHFSSRYSDEGLLLAEAQQVFPATILAQEGLTIDLNSL